MPSGYRGIQADVAGPGVYYLNRWAYIPYIIPTTNLTIDWADENGGERQTGEIQRLQLFNPLSVISRDGFEMRVSVKVVIRVRPDQAPLMVAKIGSIENLIDHVIHPMIDSSFRNQASSTQAMNFMQDRALEQSKAEAVAMGAEPTRWRACLALGTLFQPSGSAERARAEFAEARRCLELVASTLSDPALRRAFATSDAMRRACEAP